MLIAPFGGDEFLDYGKPKSSLYPTFFDVPEADKWSRSEDQCEQSRLEDWTGLDNDAGALLFSGLFPRRARSRKISAA